MNELHPEEEAIFEAALELPRPERAAFLRATCGEDESLRERIEHLLRGHEQTGILEQSAALVLRDSLVASPPLVEKPGGRIGRYKLLQQIGEGGCGVVYMAEQEKPVRRRVALKVIKLGMDTNSVIARFEAERQALALMDHPNIAKVLDAGATQTGRPYFVMELVRGIKITDYCDQNKLCTEDRLRLFLQACHAIQHAHQKSIIHRDIKPSNILVTMHDGVPVPKVIDFGIAKATTNQRLTDKTVFTAFEQFIGTPAYMSPEQAEMSGLDIDTRSDIYALGVLLYELLTGCTPFDSTELVAQGVEAMRRTLREKDPAPPSRRLSTMREADRTAVAGHHQSGAPKLISLLRGDLDWIVMKCLEKDRTHRYPTANGLATDIQRHLTHEPIVARPPTATYRLRKLVRRNRFAFATLGAVSLALLIGLGGVSWQWRRAERHAQGEARLRRLTQAQATETKLNLYAADVSLASQAIQRSEFGLARRTLAALKPPPGEPDLRGFEWRMLWNLCRGDQLATLTGHEWIVTSAAFSPDGKLIATGSQDATTRIWDADRHQPVTTLRGVHEAVWSVAFSPDGGLLMTASSSGTITFRDTVTWRTVTNYPGQIATLSKTGSVMAAVNSSPFFSEPAGNPVLWDYRSGKKLREFSRPGRALALAPDGKRLAVAGPINGIDLWNTVSGTLEQTLATDHAIWSLNFSPDGKRLLAAGWSSDVLCWSLESVAPPQKLHGHSLTCWSAAFSPDGHTIASASSDQTVRLWDAATLIPKGILRGHDNEVWCLAFSPDGWRLATGGKDQNVMLWSPTPPSLPKRLPNRAWTRPLFSPDGTQILTALPENPAPAATLWNLADGTAAFELPPHRQVFGFTPDGQRVITLNDDLSAFEIWTPQDGSQTGLPLANPGPKMDGLELWGFSPEWKDFFAIDRTGQVRLWDAVSGRLLGTVQGPVPPIRAAVLGPKGKHLAISVERENIVRLYETSSMRETQLAGHRDYVSGLAFSPDGTTLATGSMDGTIRLWDTAGDGRFDELPGHMQETTDLVFSPDGRTLASVCRTEAFKFWHLATRRELCSWKLPRAGMGLQFSPDGRYLAVNTEDNSLELFAAPTLEELDRPALSPP